MRKKRNPPDATLRNIRAAKKREAAIWKAIATINKRLDLIVIRFSR